MFRSGNKIPIGKIETVIGPNANFNGHLRCDGSVRIDGVCEAGLIETLGNVIVGENAKVAADIIAQNVSVSGAVTGKITAQGRLEVLSTGKVWGAVKVQSFLLDEGAFFRGQLVMDEDLAPPDIPTSPPPQEELEEHAEEQPTEESGYPSPR